MKRHGADMLWKVCTYEEMEEETEERWNEGDTGRIIETDIFTYKQAHTYKHALHTTVFLHKDCITHIRFYIQTLYTQSLLHINTFTQTLLHTNSFTHRRFYTQTLLHTDAFTHRPFRTNTFTHKHFYTQTLLHTDRVTHKHVGRKTLQWAGSSHDSHMTLTRPMLHHHHHHHQHHYQPHHHHRHHHHPHPHHHPQHHHPHPHPHPHHPHPLPHPHHHHHHHHYLRHHHHLCHVTHLPNMPHTSRTRACRKHARLDPCSQEEGNTDKQAKACQSRRLQGGHR